MAAVLFAAALRALGPRLRPGRDRRALAPAGRELDVGGGAVASLGASTGASPSPRDGTTVVAARSPASPSSRAPPTRAAPTTGTTPPRPSPTSRGPASARRAPRPSWAETLDLSGRRQGASTSRRPRAAGRHRARHPHPRRRLGVPHGPWRAVRARLRPRAHHPDVPHDGRPARVGPQRRPRPRAAARVVARVGRLRRLAAGRRLRRRVHRRGRRARHLRGPLARRVVLRRPRSPRRRRALQPPRGSTSPAAALGSLSHPLAPLGQHRRRRLRRHRVPDPPHPHERPLVRRRLADRHRHLRPLDHGLRPRAGDDGPARRARVPGARVVHALRRRALEQPQCPPTTTRRSSYYQASGRRAGLRRGRPGRRVRLAGHAGEGRRRHHRLHERRRAGVLGVARVAGHHHEHPRLQVRLRRGSHPQPGPRPQPRALLRTVRPRAPHASSPSTSTRPIMRPSTPRTPATRSSSRGRRRGAVRRRRTSSGRETSTPASSTRATRFPAAARRSAGCPRWSSTCRRSRRAASPHSARIRRATAARRPRSRCAAGWSTPRSRR